MTARVLIVDDDDPVRRLMASALKRQGYQTVEARNGEEALRLLGSEPTDIVVLDLMMPIKSGFDFIAQLRKDQPDRLRSVVVVTAASERVTQQLDRTGLFAIVEKPFDVNELVRTISDCADSLGPQLDGLPEIGPQPPVP